VRLMHARTMTMVAREDGRLPQLREIGFLGVYGSWAGSVQHAHRPRPSDIEAFIDTGHVGFLLDVDLDLPLPLPAAVGRRTRYFLAPQSLNLHFGSIPVSVPFPFPCRGGIGIRLALPVDARAEP